MRPTLDDPILGFTHVDITAHPTPMYNQLRAQLLMLTLDDVLQIQDAQERDALIQLVRITKAHEQHAIAA